MTTGYVYIIQSEDTNSPIKIGVSTNVESRLEGLQTSHHKKLVVRYILECLDEKSAYAAEKLLHSRYAPYRLMGEWFGVPLETVTADLDWMLKTANFVIGGKSVEHKAEVKVKEVFEYKTVYMTPEHEVRVLDENVKSVSYDVVEFSIGVSDGLPIICAKTVKAAAFVIKCKSWDTCHVQVAMFEKEIRKTFEESDISIERHFSSNVEQSPVYAIITVKFNKGERSISVNLPVTANEAKKEMMQ